MGVHGLWRLLDATGKPVALETLEGKVLAVDVSIWLHQVMQGYQDGRGNPLPNAHLLGLFNRICKLLYYKIKPVFVFDGGVPLLKKNTIASRRKQKSMANSKAQRMKTDLINNLLKRTAVKGALGADKTAEGGENAATLSQPDNARLSVHSSLDLFKLPVIPHNGEVTEDEDDPDSESDSSASLSPRKQAKWMGNIHTVDVSSAEFKALPPDVRHDILTDLKATRKQNSWGRLHEMPEESSDFANYQLKRLLKRRNVQESLEQAEKEMGGKTMTLEELDQLLTEQGIATTTHEKSSRIAGDSSTRFIYINGSTKEVPATNETQVVSKREVERKENSDSEEENLREYDLPEDWESDWESSDGQEVTVVRTKKFKKLMKGSDMNPAVAYMLEHSGLSQEEIFCIIEQSRKKSVETKGNKRSKTPDFVIKTEPPDEYFNEEHTESLDNAEDYVCAKSDGSEEDFVPVEESNGDIQTEKSRNNEDTTSGVTETNVAMMSDSESDDFLEVEDVPTAIVESFTKKEEKPPVLEIAIAPETTLEDDMFADVFANTDAKMPFIDKKDIEVKEPVKIVAKSETATITNVPESRLSVANVAKELEEKLEPARKDEPVVINDIKESVDLETGTSGRKNFDDRETVQSIDEKEKGEKEDGEEMEKKKDDEKQEKIEDDEKQEKKEDDEKQEKKEDDEKQEQEKDAEKQENRKEKEVLKLPVLREDLLSMQEQLENEEKELTGNLGRLERQATDITDQMRLEAQELLKLFGIPYVVAPMEAEAQCAYLETINLTDGTITDDSDIWLFGGRCVYKNFFNLNKHVLQFRSTDIRHHFKLTREQMIQLALLVGSDYTVGVSGIGPVTGLEILGAFPSDEGNLLRGLNNFRYWITSGRAAGPGRAALRTKLKNVRVEKGFPSEAVVQAYLTPTIDESREGFTWNKPNATLLGDFTRDKFGWTKHKFEVIFNPIVKRQTEPNKQKGIDSYFQVKVSQKSIEGALSKRVLKAVGRLGDDPVDDAVDDVEKVPQKRRRKVKPMANLDSVVEEGTTAVVEEFINAESIPSTSTAKPKPKPTAVPVSEYIPQREKDKANALKKKLRAIEVFRKSKKGPGYTKRTKKTTREIKEKAELSESSDSS